MCHDLYGYFHDFAGPVATVIAAGVAVFVTWRLGQGQLRIAKEQARLADVRLQHDLFEKRILVFDAARDLMLAVFRQSNISDEQFSSFVRGTEKTVFLFDKSVTAYIEEMRNRGAMLKGAASKLDSRELPVGAERTHLSQVRRDQSIWFTQQFDTIIEIFKPSLALERNIETRIQKPE